MGVPSSEVGYTSATTGRGDHEVHKGHVVALAKIIHSFHKALSSENINIVIIHEVIYPSL
jgi:hypothetical protein